VRQVARQALRDRNPIRRRPPRPDHPQAERLQQLDPPLREEHDRRIEDLPEELRIPRVADGDQLDPALRQLLLLDDGVFERAAARDGLRDSAADAGRLQLGPGRAKDRHGRPEPFQQFVRGACSQTRDEF
jgi:hypothetical protein